MTDFQTVFDHRIELKKGIGRISFGLSTNDVEDYLGKPDETEIVDPLTQSAIMWYYREKKLQIIFETSTKPTTEAKRIVQLVSTHPETTIWGSKIIGRNQQEILQLFARHGYKDFFESSDYPDTSPNKSLRMENIRATLDFRDGLLMSILWGKVD